MLTPNAPATLILACLSTAIAYSASETKSEPVAVMVEGGTATFVANTNVPAISVKGKSSALEAKLNLRRTSGGLLLEHIEARLPVMKLVTGMAVRDDHMRKYIFTTAGGETPDLRFEADNGTCTSAGHGETCPVSGTLAIRGVARPFTVPLKIREEGGVFKAAGDAVVKLSAYGIEPPSQLGVKTNDDVHLHFEFAARPETVRTALAGGNR